MLRTLGFVAIGLMAGTQALGIEELSIVKRISRKAAEAGISGELMARIAYTESGMHPGAKRHNKDGTLDLGLFQINSKHWDKRYRVDNRKLICEDLNIRLVDDNIECAIRLVKIHKKHEKRDKNWEGRYHSKTPSKKKAYANKLKRVSRKLLIASIGVRG